MNSKILFIMVDESIEIFFPIFQLGCFSANFGLILCIFFGEIFKKGPPDAVNITFSISFLFSFLIIFQIEKPNDVHSRCQSRGTRRLDGVIHYTKSKAGKIVLTKVDLERPNCWPKKLSSTNPVSKVSL